MRIIFRKCFIWALAILLINVLSSQVNLSQAVECNEAEAPACNGTCPVLYSCFRGEFDNNICECRLLLPIQGPIPAGSPTNYTCTSAQAPACNGTCEEPTYNCVNVEGECQCRPYCFTIDRNTTSCDFGYCTNPGWVCSDPEEGSSTPNSCVCEP